MKKLLKIGYDSQWDNDAVVSKNDCWAASLEMVAKAHGVDTTTDKITALSGAGTGYTNFTQARKSIKALGLKWTDNRNMTIKQLREAITNDKPVIALVNYSYMPHKQDTKFNGPHFLVVVGIEGDSFILNDPNFWGDRRWEGEGMVVTSKQMDDLINKPNEGNPKGALFIFDPVGEITQEDEKDEPKEAQTDQVNYLVKSGDTLAKIAKLYHTTVDKIVKDNNIADRNKIYVGQNLAINYSGDNLIAVGDKVVVRKPVEFMTGRSLNVAGQYDVIQINADRVVIGRGGKVTAAVAAANLQKV